MNKNQKYDGSRAHEHKPETTLRRGGNGEKWRSRKVFVKVVLADKEGRELAERSEERGKMLVSKEWKATLVSK